MNFKGTAKRSQAGLEKEVEDMGGHLNAYTTREQTVYMVKAMKKDVGQGVDLLGDLLLNSTYDEAAVEREKGVISREHAEIESMPEEVIFDRLHETAYQGSTMGNTILGPLDHINAMTRGDLVDFVSSQYLGPRVVVSGAGGVEHEALVDMASKAFGNLPAQPAAGQTVEPPAAHFVGSDLRVRDDNLPMTHIALGFETGGWTDGHAMPLMVMQEMLGQWNRSSPLGQHMSSNLCRKLANEGGVQSVTSFNTTYKSTGLFGVYFVAAPNNIFNSTFTALHEMARLAVDPSEKEVERAKQALKVTMLGSLDGTTAVAEDIGRQLLAYGRRMTPAEILARIDAVNVDAVAAAASAVIYDQDLAVAAVGNSVELPDYNTLRRRTYLARV
jgi:processing peptidase subunit beta